MQYSRFHNALDEIKVGLQYEKPLEPVLAKSTFSARRAIGAVPIPTASVILESGSPFTAYCRLRELCEVDALESLTWLDPYVDDSIFHRYLSTASPDVSVTLVTCEPRQNASNRDRRRWAEFLDVSRLFASERSSSTYRLLIQKRFHDRWVVLDGKRIYSLGGSAKDAGDRTYFTISAVSSTRENLAAITHHIDTATEAFGPSTNTHL